MLNRLFRLAFVVTAFAAAAPAYAAGSVTLPEPSTMTLMALASAGVVLGRRLSKKKPPAE
ncbi:MAG TPA: PEP-CTERM sorting domain-containing protein [Novosphingobium sp.]|nr:PEP-CTERM sorting domain-containing protein [Novosphingobium sp.]